MPLERDVAIVLVVEVLHLLCPSGGTAHHGDEPRGTGTLLWGVGGGQQIEEMGTWRGLLKVHYHHNAAAMHV